MTNNKMMNNKKKLLEDVIFTYDINMENQICYNNDIKRSELQIDEGILYGLSFFETILIKNKGIFITEHIQRLNNSLNKFNIPIQIEESLITDLIHYYKLDNCGLRFQVSHKNIIASARPLPYTREYYDKGVSVSLSPIVKSSESLLVRHKSSNYGDMYLSLQETRLKGYDDCLFLNEKGYLTESCIANLFVIINDNIYTPYIEDGILPGIVRSFILEHNAIEEKHITTEELLHSQGAFLTNSLVGLVDISYYNDVKLQKHQLQKQLADLYFKFIES